jgi:hypothetical protein
MLSALCTENGNTATVFSPFAASEPDAISNRARHIDNFRVYFMFASPVP